MTSADTSSNEASFDRIMDIIRQAKEQGGEILVGGGGKPVGYCSRGHC